MTYQFIPDSPPILEEEEYFPKAIQLLEQLLKDCPNDEAKFQDFFEKNPCFVPGSRDEFGGIGPSGHSAHLCALISQPNISGIVNRKPDFMWLASDSAYFVPVLVEIEAPSKKYFKKDGTPTSEFNQARHQLEEWQATLNRPENILKFYQDFAIPKELSDLTFKPHYILIYGRRSEFENDTRLKQKRGAMVGYDQTIMTYDRILPAGFNDHMTCCNVKGGKYFAKTLSPTFSIGPYKDHLLDIENLINAVDNTQFISDERKQFLKERIPYCINYLKTEADGTYVWISGSNDQIEE